jgi:hypothetical protein
MNTMASQHKNIPPLSTLLETRKTLASYGLCYAERSDLTVQKWVSVARPVVRGTIPVVQQHK